MHKLLLIAISLLWIACRSDPSGTDDAGDGDLGDATDGFDAIPDDPPLPPGCTGPVPSAPQCSNCIDDDNDGYIDSYDVQCTTSVDQLESSFATGIPDDPTDPAIQDCFFDANDQATNDGCAVHVCCLLGATTRAACPISQSQYNPNSCPPPIGNATLTQMCTSTCGALTLPGCDCFGCCTLCDPASNACRDVQVNPNVSPTCTLDKLSDATACKSCQKTPSCGKPACGGTSCVLCLGQGPEDLDPSCNGTPACPAGTSSCANGAACPAGTYCHAGSRCCIAAIPFP